MDTSITEVWKPVVDFEGWYEVSNLGRVKRVGKGKAARPGRILVPTNNTGGYPTVWLSLPNPARRFARMVHLLVAAAFLGPSEGREVNHKDGCKEHNSFVNLEYTSRQENANHAKLHRLYQRGEHRHNTCLDDHMVKVIRNEYQTTGILQRELAKKYGMTQSGMSSLLSGKTWKHVQ